ncbi:MAG: putative thioredoxin [Hyperionvirus sp.]|uniref:Putative thioredoxin n=1 Tax=Hyperionvirus sp. TaxID=2487770 RepID=A0A3G5AC03_9VIRU|nr:MAG: putative thioredoxin [Hyperionvirus sp.]
MDRETIIIGILIVIIIILLITNFQKVTEHFNQPKHKLCLYRAGYCGACTRFKPIWDKFVGQNKSDRVVIESVDCQKDSNLCKNIDGYPTVMLHKNDGTNVEFTGARTVDALNDFVRAH